MSSNIETDKTIDISGGFAIFRGFETQFGRAENQGYGRSSMKKWDVPQDDSISRGVKEVTYAVDENGRYVTVQSVGWEPKNIANDQAWDEIQQQVRSEIEAVQKGNRSPLAYHMTKNLMNPGLLASYMGISSWRVRQHLKPKGFDKLPPDMLERYAELFEITVSELKRIPESTTSDQEPGRP